MQHTLIAVFDNHNDAVSAKNELLSSGFSSSEVRLSHGDESAPGGSMSSTSGAAPSASTDHEPGIGESIKNFFADIFGADTDEHSTKYASAVERGNHVLTVNTDSEPEVERAADIVERFGPIDIDEQSEKWGMTEGSGAMMGGARSMSGGQSMSLQSDPDRLPLNQQSLNDPVPMGTTYQEPMGTRDELSVGSYGAGTGSSLQQNQAGSLSGSSLEGSAATRSNLQGSQTGSSALGSQQRDTGSGMSGMNISKREVQRPGVRVFSRGLDTSSETSMSGMGSTSSLVDDDYYRKHYSATYSGKGDYDSYKPAYSYGTQMRESQMYRNRPWDEVETDLRSDWESRNVGNTGSTWEDIKAAVRHGWDKITK
mgnify:CR=1 FL=1